MVLWSVRCLFAFPGRKSFLSFCAPDEKKRKKKKKKFSVAGEWAGPPTNKVVNGKQVTICFHVNDCKILHESTKVVDDVIVWLQFEYKNIFEDGLGAMKVHRGKHHTYLGMALDYSHNGECHVTMYDYLDGFCTPLTKP